MTSLNRRHALTGAATVGVALPLLAACSGDDSTSGSDAGQSSAGSPSRSGGALAATADIPVGGGRVFADEGVVVVQPTEGEFKAWSSTCTHQGCAVNKVEDGKIVCPCHMSEFSVTDGAPESGPATKPLPEVKITVTGDSITLA